MPFRQRITAKHEINEDTLIRRAIRLAISETNQQLSFWPENTVDTDKNYANLAYYEGILKLGGKLNIVEKKL